MKRWEDLEIRDNFLFQQVMKNRRICKRLIEKVLGISIREITYPETEKTQDGDPDKKSVRLDVYVEDDTGALYNIEMQTTDSPQFGGLAKRARYYGSMLDVNALKKGGRYGELPKTYVIFICTFDSHGMGRSIYTFRRICKEERTPEMGDDTTMVFLCTGGHDDDADLDVKRFLNFVEGKAAEGKFVQEIEAEIERLKEHMETRREYMTLEMLLEEREAESREEGRAEGREEARVSLLRNLVQKLGLSFEKAMETLDIPMAERAKYMSMM
jgi:hypothetical protein